MRIEFTPTHKPVRIKQVGSLFLMLALFAMPLTSYAADKAASKPPLRAPALQGQLPSGYSAHYLAIEPTQRDGIVTLTLTITPQDNRRVGNRVNLWVFSPEGLRALQAGEKPEQVAIAAGNPTVLDDDADAEEIYHKEATFKASARQVYTVMVYSRALIPTTYTLTADNAMLVDASGQTKIVAESASGDQTKVAEETTQAEPTATPTTAAQPTATVTSKPAAPSAPQATSTPTAQPPSGDEGGDESGGDE